MCPFYSLSSTGLVLRRLQIVGHIDGNFDCFVGLVLVIEGVVLIAEGVRLIHKADAVEEDAFIVGEDLLLAERVRILERRLLLTALTMSARRILRIQRDVAQQEGH